MCKKRCFYCIIRSLRKGLGDHVYICNIESDRKKLVGESCKFKYYIRYFDFVLKSIKTCLVNIQTYKHTCLKRFEQAIGKNSF